MVKAFMVRLFPLILICLADFLLWVLLRGEFDSGGGRGQVYEYFVMYVFYFTLFVAVFCVAASLAMFRSDNGVASKVVYFSLSIMPAAFSLIVGLLSVSLAFNGVFMAIFPAFIYFIASLLLIVPGFVLKKILRLRLR